MILFSIIKTDRAKRFENLKHYFTKEYPAKKGQTNFIVGIPYVNNFHLEPVGESSVNSTGFFGFSTGIEYFYTNKNYFAVNFRAVTDYELPILLPYMTYNELISVSFNLLHNHKIQRFSVGYGINYTKNRWSKDIEYDEYGEIVENSESIAKNNKALGITLNSYYQVSPIFYLGLNYNQSLLNLNDSYNSQFEHVISLDFVFKFSLNKNKL